MRGKVIWTQTKKTYREGFIRSENAGPKDGNNYFRVPIGTVLNLGDKVHYEIQKAVGNWATNIKTY